MWCSFEFQLRDWLNWPSPGRVVIRSFVQVLLKKTERERAWHLHMNYNKCRFVFSALWLLITHADTLYVLRGVIFFFGSFRSFLPSRFLVINPIKMTKSRQQTVWTQQTMQAHVFFGWQTLINQKAETLNGNEVNKLRKRMNRNGLCACDRRNKMTKKRKPNTQQSIVDVHNSWECESKVYSKSVRRLALARLARQTRLALEYI